MKKKEYEYLNEYIPKVKIIEMGCYYDRLIRL